MSTLPQLALQLETVNSFTPSTSTTPELEKESAFEGFDGKDAIYELDNLERERDTTQTTRPRRASFGNVSVVNALPPVDRGPAAMTFLASSFVLETFIWGYGFTFSLIFVYLTTHEPFSSSSPAAISAVGTISLALNYILPSAGLLVFQRYADRVKTFLWIAIAINFIAFLASSWATSVWQLILLQGVIGGATSAVLYIPVLLWIPEHFIERRGFATGIIFAGTGLGGSAFPLLLGALLEKVGFGNTIRIWSCVTLVAYSGSVYMIKPRIPASKTRREDRGKFLPVSWAFVREPVVLLMCLTVFIFSLAFFPISIYIATYASALSPGSLSTATYVLAVYNFSSVLGQIAVGWLSDDRVPYSILMSAIGFLSAVVCFFSFGFASTLPLLFLFALLFGAVSGICSVWSSVAKDIAGTNAQLPALIFSCFGIARGIASVLGPILASTLYDERLLDSKEGTFGLFGFRNIIIFVGCLSFLSGLGGIAMGLARNSRVKKGHSL